MGRRAAPASKDDDEFARHERNQEEILWLQDFAFNTSKVPFPTILLVGKRFSGKSYTSVSIAAKFDVPRWAAWCGTKDTEDFWAERFESNATVKGPDEKGKSYLINVIRYQQRKGRLYKKILKQPFPRKFTVGLIFDDVTAKRQFRKGEILEDLFSNGRHYHAVIIISAQYLKQLPPAVRLNTDYMFMMHNTKRTIKVLYEDYVEEPDEFGMFLDLIRSVTGQKDPQGNDLYNALVYDNVKKTQKLEEIFKIYRNEGEKYLDDIKLGDQGWREYNKAHYKDEDYELQLREHRKQQRMMRLQQYREQQILRRNQPNSFMNPLGQADLDYYDDTDSEDEDEKSHHDTVTLQHKGGSSTKINFLKRATAGPVSAAGTGDVTWNMPTTSGYASVAPVAPNPWPQPQQQQQQQPWPVQQQQQPQQVHSWPQSSLPSPAWGSLPQQQQQPPSALWSQPAASSLYPSWQQQQPQQPTYPSSWPATQQQQPYQAWTQSRPLWPQQQQPQQQQLYAPSLGHNAYKTPWPAPQPQQQQPYAASYAAGPSYTNPSYAASAYKSPWLSQQQQQPQQPSWTAQQDYIRNHSVYVPQSAGSSSRFFL